MPHTEETKPVHDLLLTAMDYFHEICVSNDIKYSLHGGSLLGAVREKGFIPWDDDIDITMPRREYTKFLDIIRNQRMREGFWLDDLSYRVPHFCCKKDNSVAWVSVFVYDFISEKTLSRKLKILGIGFFVTIDKDESYFSGGRNGKYQKGKAYHFYRLLWRLFKNVPKRRKLEWTDSFCKKCFLGHRKWVHRSNDAFEPVKLILPASVTENYVMVPFEDREYMITAEYDKVLRSSYGDTYMTPRRDDSKNSLHERVRNDLSNC